MLPVVRNGEGAAKISTGDEVIFKGTKKCVKVDREWEGGGKR